MVESKNMHGENETHEQQAPERKVYVTPQVIHELELEVRTGSPINISPFDIISED